MALRILERGQARTCRKRRAVEVHEHEFPPLLDALAEESGSPGVAGVREGGVEAPESVERLRDRGLLLLPLAHVADDRQRSLAAEPIRQRLQLLARAREKRHTVASLEGELGGRGADAR